MVVRAREGTAASCTLDRLALRVALALTVGPLGAVLEAIDGLGLRGHEHDLVELGAERSRRLFERIDERLSDQQLGDDHVAAGVQVSAGSLQAGGSGGPAGRLIVEVVSVGSRSRSIVLG